MIVSRRAVLIAGVLLALPARGAAQEEGKVRRLAFQGLRELGYVDGRTFVLEQRHADGRFDRLVVNLKTAKALGIAIPRSVLPRADDVLDTEAR